jgi:hypothetical protein
MFHFPALPPNWLYIHQQVTRHHSRRVSPFGHPRIHARLTAPRGITQPPTSFIGSQCQGIHHAPLNTYNTKNQKKVSPQEKLFELKNSEIAHQHTRQHPPPPKRAGATLRARCSQPLSTNQTPHPTTNVERQPSPIPGFPQRDKEIAGLLPQSPIVCPMIHRRCFPTSSNVCCRTRTGPTTGQRSIHSNRPDHRTPTRCGRA